MENNSNVLFLNEEERLIAQSAIKEFLEKSYTAEYLSISQKVDMATLGASLLAKIKLQVTENADN